MGRSSATSVPRRLSLGCQCPDLQPVSNKYAGWWVWKGKSACDKTGSWVTCGDRLEQVPVADSYACCSCLGPQRWVCGVMLSWGPATEHHRCPISLSLWVVGLGVQQSPRQRVLVHQGSLRLPQLAWRTGGVVERSRREVCPAGASNWVVGSRL